MNHQTKGSNVKIEIKHRWTNACLWSGEIGEQESAPKNIGAAVKAALAAGANLGDANLRGADLVDANLGGKKIQALRAFAGLYQYQIWAYVLKDGTPCVRMGCLYKTVSE